MTLLPRAGRWEQGLMHWLAIDCAEPRACCGVKHVGSDVQVSHASGYSRGIR